jgi:beta-lactamase class A
MKYPYIRLSRLSIAIFYPVFLFLFVISFSEGALATAKRETFDIIYLRTNDFEKILDYREEIETVLDFRVRKNLEIVGTDKGDYVLLYKGNLSAKAVSQTLIKHADLLSKTGFDEPYASKENNFHSLYNVCYGMGRNLDSLKETYRLLYSSLGEEVKRDLYIEKTDFGNYLLVYRLRGDEASTILVAKKHAAILRPKKISTTLTKENSNTVEYGESSLIDDSENIKLAGHQPPDSPKDQDGPTKSTALMTLKDMHFPQQKNQSTPKNELTDQGSKVSQSERLSLPSSNSSKIEKNIVEYIENLRSKGAISNDESTGWMVYDLENDRSLLSINADNEFQAASMIKPFIALAFFHQVREGKLQYDKQSKSQMEAMIQRSNNSATNFIMRRAGGPAQCDAILKRYYSNIFKKTEIKEYIPVDGRTYLNGAPPADYIRFLRALWNQELPYSKEMRRVMALPGRDRLYYGTTIPRGTLVYNKTGSTAHLCGDMGILVTKTQKGDIYPYAIVGIIERRSKSSGYGQWMASRGQVIREVSSLVYEGLKRDHHLL